jgi:hypothetical protein
MIFNLLLYYNVGLLYLFIHQLYEYFKIYIR